jgi:hypothetical protein
MRKSKSIVDQVQFGVRYPCTDEKKSQHTSLNKGFEGLKRCLF